MHTPKFEGIPPQKWAGECIHSRISVDEQTGDFEENRRASVRDITIFCESRSNINTAASSPSLRQSSAQRQHQLHFRIHLHHHPPDPSQSSSKWFASSPPPSPSWPSSPPPRPAPVGTSASTMMDATAV
ncbi:hypothetical protein CABS03_05528 [Colletotrichum abscissum]|uniref:Uncharacterized protein n=1 Tax=Colletotrichum abscissum TaxID=1671311 RepID=A0A9P9X276_9PEZI|nr:hypothetical protein CABS02_13776 [Colletotrichum abscissum]